jgi:hypothetical protein
MVSSSTGAYRDVWLLTKHAGQDVGSASNAMATDKNESAVGGETGLTDAPSSDETSIVVDRADNSTQADNPSRPG